MNSKPDNSADKNAAPSDPEQAPGDGKGFGAIMNRIARHKHHAIAPEAEAFFRAVRTNQGERVREFLAKGFDPDAQDRNGETALNLAARHNLQDIAKILIAGRASLVKKSGPAERTPLEEAVCAGRADMIPLLSVKSACAPGLLLRAAEKDAPEAVRALLEAGADGSERTKAGLTPLMVAVEFNRAANIGAMLDFDDVASTLNTAFFDHGGVHRNAFHYALVKCNADAVGRMIDAGAFVNRRDSSGVWPLRTAILRTLPANIEKLLQGGADLHRDFAALVFACKTSAIQTDKRRGEIVDLLLRYGADPDFAESATLTTPLHAAAATGSRSAVALLLKHKAKTDVRDASGASALFHALGETKSRPADILAMMLAAGADPDIRHGKSGETPLIKAARLGQAEAVRRLLTAGADPALADNEGKTALDRAREKAHVSMQERIEKALLQKAENDRKNGDPKNGGGPRP